MDAKTCLQKLQYVGVLAFATVDEYGNPYKIQQEHCLHCGNCHEVCPVKAVVCLCKERICKED